MIDPIALLTLLGGIAVLGAASIKHIPEGQVYSLRRMGRSAPRLLMPGTHLVVPFLERIAHRISLGGRTLTLDAPVTPDGAPGLVFWQVLDPLRADAVIEQAEQMIREHIARHGSCRDGESERECALRLKCSLNEELRPRGLLVTRIDLGKSGSRLPRPQA